MRPDEYATAIVAALAALPGDRDPVPVPSTVLWVAIRYALRNAEEMSEIGDADLWQVVDLLEGRIRYQSEPG